MQELVVRALEEMTERHGCHTVILYGSRARGDWTRESDLDVLGVREGGEPIRDARVLDGVFLDAFIYPESKVVGHESGFLHLRGARILVEKDGFGRRLLEAVDDRFAAGPPPVPADELQARRIWFEKMLARAARGDVEGDHRRAWLSFDLLESYFSFRKLWFLGPKESFRWLSSHDPGAHGCFEAALRPGAPLADLEHLARTVAGGWQPWLYGPTVVLRPMAEEDFEPLHAVASDPLIWAQHPDRERHTRERFAVYFASGLASGGGLVVLDRASGAVIGASRFTDHHRASSSVEIGYSFLARSHWGGATNREVKSLMLGYAFRFVETVQFVVGRDNVRSRRAMGKIGGVQLDDGGTARAVDLATSVVFRIRGSDWRSGR